MFSSIQLFRNKIITKALMGKVDALQNVETLLHLPARIARFEKSETISGDGWRKTSDCSRHDSKSARYEGL